MSSNAVSMLRFARVTTEEPRRRRAQPAAKPATEQTGVVTADVNEHETAAPRVPVRKRWPSLARPAPAALHG